MKAKANEVVRMFKIKFGWRNYGQMFKASTIWGFCGDARHALDDFLRANPHVLSAHVEGEVALDKHS